MRLTTIQTRNDFRFHAARLVRMYAPTRGQTILERGGNFRRWHESVMRLEGLRATVRLLAKFAPGSASHQALAACLSKRESQELSTPLRAGCMTMRQAA
jgi:hypothetical protein